MNQEDRLLHILCNEQCALPSLLVNRDPEPSFVLTRNPSDPEAELLPWQHFFPITDPFSYFGKFILIL